MLEIRCYYEEKFFNIQISPNETLSKLKNIIKLNLSSQGVNTTESNIIIRYGYPPKILSNAEKEKENLTMTDLQIYDKEALRIELADPKLINNESTDAIDYSKYTIKKKDIPADNSCLFNAINFCINQNDNSPEIIRSIITSEIMANPNDYNAAVLEKEPEEYCKWISKSETWGGGIELSILSKFFQIQIGVADIQFLTIEYFGNFDKCIYLLYNNIHYDAFYKEENGKIIGIFNSNDSSVKQEILNLCMELKNRDKYVDTKLFSLKCMQCGFLMNGQNEVIEHTKKTGHINFQQI